MQRHHRIQRFTDEKLGDARAVPKVDPERPDSPLASSGDGRRAHVRRHDLEVGIKIQEQDDGFGAYEAAVTLDPSVRRIESLRRDQGQTLPQ